MKLQVHWGALAVLALTPGAIADSYPRQNGIDVQHYVLRVALSDDNDAIVGEATVVIRFVKDGVREIWLDLAEEKIADLEQRLAVARPSDGSEDTTGSSRRRRRLFTRLIPWLKS